MAVYAIGDIQGCYDELQALLEQLRFDPADDRLWFVGDLVNRGPRSLDTLRFVSSLGDRAITVLGNHDLHLLALASGNKRFKDSDHLNQVLDAPDRDELISWLRHRPLMHHEKKLNFTMIHAGLPPQWNLATAQACAREVEAVLRGPDYREFFDQMYGNKPNRWDPDLEGMDRLRFITNCFTRLRFVTKKGKLKLKLKGTPLGQKKKYIPWFNHPHRLTRNDRILFGHWSTLGYQHRQNTWALDTGCLWGGALTALRIDQEPPEPAQYQCEGQQDPALFV
ncbi:symmetrical bis(5'-nucleosyl)-tetraphosphatase [Thiolapillus sp.]